MNSIFLLLALGSLEASASRGAWTHAAESLPLARVTRQDSLLVFQDVKWPKVDPLKAGKSKWDSSTPGETDRTPKGGAPSIGRSQLKEKVTNYDKPTARPTSQPEPRETKPLVKARDSVEPQEDEESTRPAARSQFSGDSRFGRNEPEDEPASESKPRFGENNRREFPERDTEFTSAPVKKTNVRRQSTEERESAPHPFEFRPATTSDDREESPRNPPYRSFAIGADEAEDDLGVVPYNESLGTNRRDMERLASNSGNSRDSTRSANGDDDSTMQGGKRMPETNSNTMWGFAVVTLLLFASMGANAYLAWVAREFYERYRSLAQQVRASRNNLT